MLLLFIVLRCANSREQQKTERNKTTTVDEDGMKDDGDGMDDKDGKNDNRTERMMTVRFDDDGMRTTGILMMMMMMKWIRYIYERKKTNRLMKDNGIKNNERDER